MTNVEDIWEEWHGEELLGSGAYGSVWRASRTSHGHTSYAAVKIMDFPQDEAELNGLIQMGMDEEAIHAYLEELANDVMTEIAAMDAVKGARNVVAIEDYKLVEHDRGFSVGIRMELLEDLPTYYQRVGDPSPAEVAKLGIDVCRALEACHDHGIIHRDIKPQNVFVSAYGDYKIGDFGISRRLEQGATTVLSQRGTRSYMAPEVFLGRRYGSSVDIYSLGLMLYRFLNGLRGPFVPPAPERVTPRDLLAADERRVRGDAIPAPAYADEGLSAIVLKACSPVPQDRYASARRMREALEGWLATGGSEQTVAVGPAEVSAEQGNGTGTGSAPSDWYAVVSGTGTGTANTSGSQTWGGATGGSTGVNATGTGTGSYAQTTVLDSTGPRTSFGVENFTDRSTKATLQDVEPTGPQTPYMPQPSTTAYAEPAQPTGGSPYAEPAQTTSPQPQPVAATQVWPQTAPAQPTQQLPTQPVPQPVQPAGQPTQQQFRAPQQQSYQAAPAAGVAPKKGLPKGLIIGGVLALAVVLGAVIGFASLGGGSSSDAGSGAASTASDTGDTGDTGDTSSSGSDAAESTSVESVEGESEEASGSAGADTTVRRIGYIENGEYYSDDLHIAITPYDTYPEGTLYTDDEDYEFSFGSYEDDTNVYIVLERLDYWDGEDLEKIVEGLVEDDEDAYAMNTLNWGGNRWFGFQRRYVDDEGEWNDNVIFYITDLNGETYQLYFDATTYDGSDPNDTWEEFKATSLWNYGLEE